MTGALLLLAATAVPPSPAGPWRAALDLAGGPLRFALEVAGRPGTWTGTLCNGGACTPLSAVRVAGDSVVFEIGEYDATITAAQRGDSLVGQYRNVGSRGPRTIPFRAARGRWPAEPVDPRLVGRWHAEFLLDWEASPRIFEFRDTPRGLEGTVVGKGGDYGLFWGRTAADSFSMAHFDGSFVYMLTGRLDGDTLRGEFHAGLRGRTSWRAWRATDAPHLPPPTDVTRADTTAPFTFAFPDLDGRLVTSADARFRGKVTIVDVFGTWCPTCHDAAPLLVELYRDYRDRGLEIVGLAYEVTGDPTVDGRLVRRYRDKFGITFPLLLAGRNDTEATSATLPQLDGFGAYPTTIFLGRDGRVRRVHAGFHGPAVPDLHARVVADFRRTVEDLLAERTSP